MALRSRACSQPFSVAEEDGDGYGSSCAEECFETLPKRRRQTLGLNRDDGLQEMARKLPRKVSREAWRGRDLVEPRFDRIIYRRGNELVGGVEKFSAQQLQLRAWEGGRRRTRRRKEQRILLEQKTTRIVLGLGFVWIQVHLRCHASVIRTNPKPKRIYPKKLEH